MMERDLDTVPALPLTYSFQVSVTLIVDEQLEQDGLSDASQSDILRLSDSPRAADLWNPKDWIWPQSTFLLHF